MNESEKLNMELHKFVNGIMMYATHPEMWPLSPKEQYDFIRTAIFEARTIVDTQQYLLEELKFSADKMK